MLTGFCGRSLLASAVCTRLPNRGGPCPASGAPPARRGDLLVVAMGRRAAKIAARKGKSDALKAKLYGKFGKRLAQCVRQGGNDPTQNLALADLIEEAKAARVPKDIIERNIGKASEGAAADFKEMVYEAYGPGGTGFLVECLTDNVNRSASDVKSAITKAGGKWAEAGSVMFNFQKKGVLMIGAEIDEDELFEKALDAGAEDVAWASGEDKDAGYKVTCDMADFASVRAALVAAGVPVRADESGLMFLAAAEVETDDEAFTKCEAMMERLLDVDDVDAVYTNCAGLTA